MNSPLQLTHKTPKMWRGKHLLACSLLFPFFRFKLQRSRTSSEELITWKLISKHIWLTRSGRRNHRKPSLQNQSNIFTCSPWKRHLALVLHVQLPWSNRMLCIGWHGFATSCGQDHPQGVRRQDNHVLDAAWCLIFHAKSALPICQ